MVGLVLLSVTWIPSRLGPFNVLSISGTAQSDQISFGRCMLRKGWGEQRDSNAWQRSLVAIHAKNKLGAKMVDLCGRGNPKH